MTDQIKITEEELNSIVNLRERILRNIESIGKMNIKKHFTELDLNEVNSTLSQAYEESENLSMEENRITQEITQKYGEGELDFNTGIYSVKSSNQK